MQTQTSNHPPSTPSYNIITRRLQKPSQRCHPPYAPSQLQLWAADDPDKSTDDISQARFNGHLNAHLDEYKFLDHHGLHPQYETKAVHRCIAHSKGMKDIKDAVSFVYLNQNSLYTSFQVEGMSRLSDSGVLVFSYKTSWDSRDPLKAADIDVDVVLSRYLQQHFGEHSDLITDMKNLICKHLALQHIIDFKQRLQQVDPGPGYSIDPATGQVKDTDIALDLSEHRTKSHSISLYNTNYCSSYSAI